MATTMDFYELKIGNIIRMLPIVSLGPKIKVASFNLLGDVELVNVITRELSQKLKNVNFDCLVGPEVKVLPLMHELSRQLKKDRYIVLRKEIHGYMTYPIKSKSKPPLVINGPDAGLIKGKKVVLVDDVVTSGKTLKTVEEIAVTSGAKVVLKLAVFKQGNHTATNENEIVFMHNLPVFTTTSKTPV